MNVEQQYIDLFSQTEAMICKHSAEVLNAPRAAALPLRRSPARTAYKHHRQKRQKTAEQSSVRHKCVKSGRAGNALLPVGRLF